MVLGFWVVLVLGIGIVKAPWQVLVLVLLRRFPKVLVLGRNFGIGHLCCHDKDWYYRDRFDAHREYDKLEQHWCAAAVAIRVHVFLHHCINHQGRP